MKFHSLHKWALGKETEALLFFAQRMDELLFDYSLDAYKPGALTSSTLCEEALDLIAEVESGIVDASNLGHVLEELVWTLRHDLVAQSLLDADVGQYVLQHTDTPLHEKKIRLEVLGKTLHERRYLVACMDLLIGAVGKKTKSDIDRLARTLVEALVGMGVSKEFLYKKTKEFFFVGDAPKLSTGEQLVDFFGFIGPVTHEFDVFFVVSKKIKSVEESIRAFGIELLDEVPEVLAEISLQKSFAPSSEEVLVQVKDIQGYDCYSARGDAERRIDMLRDMFTLFFHRNELRWRNEALIRQCCEENVAIVSASKNSMQKAFDPNEKHASKQLNWMLDNMAMHKESYRKLIRVIDMHGICVTNDVPENQLLNLWIAIETLVPSRDGRNKIGNILTEFSPFLRRTHVRRIIDRLLRDLMVWNAYVTRKIIRKVQCAKGKRMAIRLLHLLALKENEAVRSELYAELKDFHLLRFRVFSISRDLSKPISVRSLIDEYLMRVSWQIRRIYRTRNLLVHAGTAPRYLSALIENGHDYLDVVLSEILDYSCSPYRIATLGQVFELQAMLVREYERKLASIETFDQNNIDFLYQATQRASLRESFVQGQYG